MQLVFFVKQEPHCALVLEVVAITCHNGTRLTAPVRSSSPTKERLPAGSTGGCIAWGSTKKAPVTRKRKKLKKSRVLRNRKYERTPVPKRPLTLFSGTCHSWRECRKDSQLYQLCLAPWGEGEGGETYPCSTQRDSQGSSTIRAECKHMFVESDICNMLRQ